MPHEHETKPCTVQGCPGTMIYSFGVVLVGGDTTMKLRDSRRLEMRAAVGPPYVARE